MYEAEEFVDGCGGPVQAYLFMYSFIFFGCLIVFNLFVAVSGCLQIETPKILAYKLKHLTYLPTN